MRGAAALTVLEVVIALSILAVGILGAAGLQATALRATRSAQELQVINAYASSQLEAWRGLRLAQTSPDAADCSSDTLTCTVQVRPCVAMVGGLACDVGAVPNPAAHAVALTVSSGNRELTLQSVVTK